MSIPITATAAAQGEGMKRHSRHWSRLPEIVAPQPAQALAPVSSRLSSLLEVVTPRANTRLAAPPSCEHPEFTPERRASSQLLNIELDAGPKMRR